MKIKILENDMIEKIAAGEVIERPVSAVKELIENGVDAGASTITIEISGGGKDLIRVTDNGSGIEEADLENVFKRHATSKIETLNDLENVLSLGFRGEAMAAIATVSTVTLSTKTEEQSLGNIIELRGGVITKKEKKAMQKGTTIVVRNLFFNVPARRKFLKNNTTEASQIESLTAKLALANPHISFTYINEGTTKIKSLAKNLEETIYNIYGNEFRGNLIEI
ncbi:MAG: DNA mismatch repair endonuclease MutL, partial [Defluviitaleaceae bacterium]|nr:DNA mismatch repair endonuclease MutL [Defluviitaleaceae bacterium]